MSTPEPELNVEAETPEFPDESNDTPLQHSLRNMWHDNFNEQEFIEESEALIQQVSDQRVREYNEQVKKERLAHFTSWGGAQGECVPIPEINQTLSDYLSHKEASDGKPPIK